LPVDAVVMSRALASKTIARGQRKSPLLYAPLTNSQRAVLLNLLVKALKGEHGAIVASYSRHFQGLYSALMSMGAMASLGYGVGSHLAEVHMAVSGRDARLELATAGAGVEWALGLDSAYVPRNYGEGFDETHNSLIVASYLSRTTMMPSNPIANRLHTVADGLLTVSGVPPLEVAKNFNGSAAIQFRRYARRFMAATSDLDELAELVAALNEETKKFEKRAALLSKLKIDSLIVGALAKPLSDHVDSVLPYSSVGAMWLYNLIKDNMPEPIKDRLGEAVQIMQSLILGSSRDAVIISRAKNALGNNGDSQNSGKIIR